MIKTKEISILVKQLGVTPVDVAKYISRGSSDIPGLLFDIVEKEIRRIENEELYMAYLPFSAKMDNDQLKIKGINFQTGDEVAKMLSNIESIALFACTVSEKLNTKLNLYNNKEQFTEAYIADIIGTKIVEKSLEILYQQLQTDIKKYDLYLTNTISPGNCGWPVEEQKKLFQLFPENYLGISLNESGMMHPVKSLSGIIGVGKSVKFKHTDCEQCASKNCMYREAPFKK
ncbi:MAG: vitamin B12 dependent-methionine synthase activation domain-containing protein [Bacteroidota bacterium]